MRIAPAIFPEDAATVRTLFRAYLEGLGIDLGFQGIEAEQAEKGYEQFVAAWQRHPPRDRTKPQADRSI